MASADLQAIITLPHWVQLADGGHVLACQIERRQAIFSTQYRQALALHGAAYEIAHALLVIEHQSRGAYDSLTVSVPTIPASLWPATVQ